MWVLTCGYSKSTASLPATPKPTTLPALRSPPARSVRASPMPSVSLLRRRILRPSSTSPASSFSTTTHTCSSVMAAPWRVLPARLPPLPVICSWAT